MAISKRDVEELMTGTMKLENDVDTLYKHIQESQARLPFLPEQLQEKEKQFILQCLYGIELCNATIVKSKAALVELLKTVDTVARA